MPNQNWRIAGIWMTWFIYRCLNTIWFYHCRSIPVHTELGIDTRVENNFSMEKRLAKNAILNTISTALVILFPLITYPYVSRVLGVEKLGIYNFSYSFLSYFLLIAALGISTYGIREGIRYREDGLQFKRFVSEVFSINIISTAVAYILLFFSFSLFRFSINTQSLFWSWAPR